jgi:hypothetical protein
MSAEFAVDRAVSLGGTDVRDTGTGREVGDKCSGQVTLELGIDRLGNRKGALIQNHA